ncbi:MAG: hypothetical protein SFX73_06725 [Kofleriaceae bacterium]|nr:hypothetical protein [Kofleriaceae bacterium]
MNNKFGIAMVLVACTSSKEQDRGAPAPAPGTNLTAAPARGSSTGAAVPSPTAGDVTPRLPAAGEDWPQVACGELLTTDDLVAICGRAAAFDLVPRAPEGADAVICRASRPAAPIACSRARASRRS